jgi:hypothetical protein
MNKSAKVVLACCRRMKLAQDLSAAAEVARGHVFPLRSEATVGHRMQSIAKCPKFSRWAERIAADRLGEHNEAVLNRISFPLITHLMACTCKLGAYFCRRRHSGGVGSRSPSCAKYTIVNIRWKRTQRDFFGSLLKTATIKGSINSTPSTFHK